MAFPSACAVVRPRGIGAACVAVDESAALRRMEATIEAQVRPPFAPAVSTKHPSTRPFRSPHASPPLRRRRRRRRAQRNMIRKALADTVPLGQKTVRGTLTDMMHDGDGHEVEEDDGDDGDGSGTDDGMSESDGGEDDAGDFE